MRKHFFYLALLFTSVFCIHVAAQNADVGIGQWRVHLPYSIGKTIAENGNTVFCAGLSGLFSYNKEDGSVKRISRVNGLSDFEFHQIRYSFDTRILVIA